MREPDKATWSNRALAPNLLHILYVEFSLKGGILSNLEMFYESVKILTSPRATWPQQFLKAIINLSKGPQPNQLLALLTNSIAFTMQGPEAHRDQATCLYSRCNLRGQQMTMKALSCCNCLLVKTQTSHIPFSSLNAVDDHKIVISVSTDLLRLFEYLARFYVRYTIR